MKKILLCTVLIIVFAFMSSCEQKEDISGNSAQSETQQNTEQFVESELQTDTEQIIESESQPNTEQFVEYVPSINTEQIFESETKQDTEKPEESKPKEFLVVEVGGYHYYSGANHKREVDWEDKFFEKSDVEKTKTIKFYGKEFSLVYIESVDSVYYKSDYDKYKFQSEDKKLTAEVWIYSETGMLKHAYYKNKDYLNEKENEKELSQEECFNVAKSYLNEYIDLNNFELTYSGDYKTSYSKMNYYFDFTRIVNGFSTCEKVNIDVTAHGDVVNYTFFARDAMKDAVAPTDEEMKIIRENISAKLDAIYSNVSDKYNISYNEEKVNFSRVSDGRYVLEYTIGAKLTPKNESTSDTISQEMEETVFLLVYLD